MASTLKENDEVAPNIDEYELYASPKKMKRVRLNLSTTQFDFNPVELKSPPLTVLKDEIWSNQFDLSKVNLHRVSQGISPKKLSSPSPTQRVPSVISPSSTREHHFNIPMNDKELALKMRSFIINLKIKDDFEQTTPTLEEDHIEELFLARCEVSLSD